VVAGLKTDGAGVLNLSLVGKWIFENAFFSKPYVIHASLFGFS
jgi:hypothetical protein